MRCVVSLPNRLLWLALLVVALGLLPPTSTNPARLYAQAPTCTLTLDTPTEQYVLPSVNGGSYGTTSAPTLTALGTDPSRAWFVVVFDPDSTPPTYAWILAQDVTAADDCSAVPMLDPNDVAGSLAAAASTDPTTSPTATPASSASPSPTAQPLPTAANDCTISAVFANIRAEPSTESEIVGELSSGAAPAIGRTEAADWYEVQLPDGRGWVAARASSAEGDCANLPITGSSTLAFAECPAGFVGYREPRLEIGSIGRVPPTNQANRVRALPQLSSAILFQIQPGGEFTVIAGPQCGDGIVWWNIQQGARTGWTAESDAALSGYFLEPVERDPTTTTALQCDPGDADYRPTRLLESDRSATVSNEIPSLILFTEPNLNSTSILEIPSGVQLDNVNVGPRCNQNAVWWNVTYNTLSGWVVESSTNDPNVEYYLLPPERAPGSPTPTPADDTPANPPANGATTDAATADASGAATALDTAANRITAFNTRDLVQAATLPYSPVAQPFLLWGPNGQVLVLNTAQGVQAFAYPSLDPLQDINDALNAALEAAGTSPRDDPATAADLDASGETLIIGYQSGVLRLVDLSGPSVLTLPFDYAAPVSVVDISTDNTRLLTASGAVYDIPPSADVTFGVRVHDFSALDPATGEMPLHLADDFPLTEPVLAGALALNNRAVVALFDRVRVLSTEAIAYETRRAEVMEGIFVQPTTNAWAQHSGSVLFGSGPAVAVYDVRTGQVLPRPVVLAEGGLVQHLAQSPVEPGLEPVIAAYVDYSSASDGISGVYFITRADNSGRVAGFIAVNAVVGLAFSPGGETLAMMRAASVEFWALASSPN